MEEPNQFVSDDEDEQNSKSIRNSAIQLLFQLIENYTDEALQAIVICVEKFMMNFDGTHTLNIITELFSKHRISDQQFA